MIKRGWSEVYPEILLAGTVAGVIVIWFIVLIMACWGSTADMFTGAIWTWSEPQKTIGIIIGISVFLLVILITTVSYYKVGKDMENRKVNSIKEEV